MREQKIVRSNLYTVGTVFWEHLGTKLAWLSNFLQFGASQKLAYVDQAEMAL